MAVSRQRLRLTRRGATSHYMAKLKVYRTPAGFHDAYVAAPSQKAALAAWGSTANLFARGIAEVVTDPALIGAPLAQPGTIVRIPRTMPDEPEPPPRKTIASVVAPTPSQKSSQPAQPKLTPQPKPKPKPKPSRTRLDHADAASEALAARHADERRALKCEESALATKRRALGRKQAQERTASERAQAKAREAYAAALKKWRNA